MPLGVETVTRALIKRAQRGLYAGRQKLFGNKISEDGGNKCDHIGRPLVRWPPVSCSRALIRISDCFHGASAAGGCSLLAAALGDAAAGYIRVLLWLSISGPVFATTGIAPGASLSGDCFTQHRITCSVFDMAAGMRQ